MIQVGVRLAGIIVFGVLAGGAWAAEVEVRPGSVVRWAGDGVESCATGGQRWSPVEGSCWYPVDLLTDAGAMELRRWRDGSAESVTVRVSEYPYPVQRLTVSEDKVHLSEADLERVQRESSRVADLWDLVTPRRFGLPLAAPLDPMPEPRSFGNRRILNDEPRSPHSGIDMKAPRGTPVHAVADGVVVLAGNHFFAGNSVYLDHGGGLISMSFHLHEIRVEEGQEVERGQVIGTVGSTGRSTGPHLHLGLRWHGARVDPGLLIGGLDEVPVVGGS